MAAEPREFDELENVDIAHTREEFRCWLENNHGSERECWLKLKRGRPTEDAFAYLDAVEEALCFGWIDGHLKSFEGCGALQRFTPRSRGSSWSELNKERVRRLERLGKMTDVGRACLPAMGPRSFRIYEGIEGELKKARCGRASRAFRHFISASGPTISNEYDHGPMNTENDSIVSSKQRAKESFTASGTISGV